MPPIPPFAITLTDAQKARLKAMLEQARARAQKLRDEAQAQRLALLKRGCELEDEARGQEGHRYN